MGTYQIVAECAHVTVSTVTGRMQTLLLKGALVPADAPELPRLLDLGYVAEVGGGETGGVDAYGVPAGAYTTDVPASVTSTPVERVEEQRGEAQESARQAEVDAERAAAREKLAALGGDAPDGRAAKAVHVEYLAGRGFGYDALVKADKAELVEMTKQESQKS